MTFDLPELLQAERNGRAMARRAMGAPETVFRTEMGLRGAAALAAARHLHNHGTRIAVTLLETGAAPHPAAEVMLRVIRRMGIDVERTDEGLRRSGRLHPTKASELWDRYQPMVPFLRKADPAEALSAEAIREVDRKSEEVYGLPGLCLMENAGIGATVMAADILAPNRRTPLVPKGAHGDGPVTVLVGYGNNGGDGLVVARGLLEKGEDVLVYLLGDPDRLGGDAALNLRILSQAPNVVTQGPSEKHEWIRRLRASRLIVDAVFGTGLSREVEGRAATVIRALNMAERRVLALDLPSGLHADTGEIMGVAVRATGTVTFAAPKPGLFAGEGPDCAGETVVADIGCPQTLLDEARGNAG